MSELKTVTTLVHLSDAQRNYLISWLLATDKKPSPSRYATVSKEIRRLPVCKIKISKIERVTVTGKDEVIPSNRFCAIKHLPPGWGLTRLCGDASTCRVCNAGGEMMRNIYNYWSDDRDCLIDPDSVYGAWILAQLRANNIYN